MSAPGVIIVRPKTQLLPDVLVFQAPPVKPTWERVREYLLAVEVQSRSTKIYDRDYKRPAYLGLGAKEMWRVVPDERVIFVSNPGVPPDVPCSDVLIWEPPNVGGRLELPLDQIFRGFV